MIYNYGNCYAVNGELYHHGVKGMRWGIRKAREIIGGAARARSGYTNTNPQYNAGRMTKNAIGNALIGKYHNGPRREKGLQKLAANAGRKMLGRQRVYAQRHTYTHSRNENAISVGRAVIERSHINRVNVTGNNFRRLSQSSQASTGKRYVRKLLNTMGSKGFDFSTGGLGILEGRNKYSSSGKRLGYSVGGHIDKVITSAWDVGPGPGRGPLSGQTYIPIGLDHLGRDYLGNKVNSDNLHVYRPASKIIGRIKGKRYKRLR